MRADDVQWIDPARMHMSGTCVRMILRRTKTTGPGRRAVEVPAYVARDASLSGEDWLGQGWELYHSPAFQNDRDYLRHRIRIGLEVPASSSTCRI